MVTMQSPPLETSPEGDQLEHRVFGEVKLRLPAEWVLSWEVLSELGELNEPYRFERAADGRLVVTGTPPMAADWIENQLRDQIRPWMKQGGGGMLRGGSSGSTFPDDSLLVPDLSWIPSDMLPERGDADSWNAEPNLVPPFVVEIRSPGQRLIGQQRKMAKYIANGVKLGWLIDPRRRQIHIYRPNREPEVLDDPGSLSGEDVMEGLVVDLSDLWP